MEVEGFDALVISCDKGKLFKTNEKKRMYML